MSGGLDSSVAAARLAEQGREVIGLTLLMFREGSRCCSLEDIERARVVCDHLGLRHYTVNAVELFHEKIIEPFIDTYLEGRTPSPCVLCNQFLKFGALQQRARELGCEQVATGHYARVERVHDTYRLLRARDHHKDQSYFLHRLDQEQLGRVLFPLEGVTKDEAAAYARKHDLPVTHSLVHESQDLCFVPPHGHAGFVEKNRPGKAGPGDVVDAEGRVLGHHGGVHRFTVGQRRGLGVAAPERLYVSKLDPARREVTLAARKDLYRSVCTVSDMHWIAGHPPKFPLSCRARIRYRHQAAEVEVEDLQNGRIRLVFAEPQFAVTPGQAAVLYHGDHVLGGGWIALEDHA
jgi:tRNA-specific 2-thiouridylase